MVHYRAGMIDERATLPASAARVAEDRLRRLDALVPGLVTGMHVVGSAALGDYHDGVSDLDVVAELSGEADTDGLAALAEAHAGPGFPSKSRGGAVAAERWPDLAEPMATMVDGRAGKPVRLTVEHGEAAVELGRRILADVQAN